ncbi:RING-H2 finger protein ATL3F [Panicum miliaceum]|uniref:RING-H2 finger protein ATL3F n=1 Tax=Panicum miliaceum TaxID=4540 RepID=A0A3L6SY66_PANMI|nr:RING-H2 finger protein ATL3F [Panicum miliaceum]
MESEESDSEELRRVQDSAWGVAAGGDEAVLVIICLCSKNNHHQDQQQADARLPEEMKSFAIALLDSVTYPRRNAAAAGGDDPSSAQETAAVEEDCAICLGPFEDGDLCSVMPVCRPQGLHRRLVNDGVQKHLPPVQSSTAMVSCC